MSIKINKSIRTACPVFQQSLDTVLGEVSDFSLEDKEVLSEILKKRIIEEKRSLIFQEYQKSLKNYRKGDIECGGVEHLFKLLKK